MGDPFERADGRAARRPRPVGGREGRKVVFGTARTTTAVPADHAARLAPLTDTDVDELLTAPRCATEAPHRSTRPP